MKSISLKGSSDVGFCNFDLYGMVAVPDTVADKGFRKGGFKWPCFRESLISAHSFYNYFVLCDRHFTKLRLLIREF